MVCTSNISKLLQVLTNLSSIYSEAGDSFSSSFTAQIEFTPRELFQVMEMFDFLSIKPITEGDGYIWLTIVVGPNVCVKCCAQIDTASQLQELFDCIGPVMNVNKHAPGGAGADSNNK